MDREGVPMMRRTPLRARRWGIARKPPRRLLTSQSDVGYLDWVHGEPCCVRGMMGAGPCRGRIEANHAGRKPGIALKAHDRTCLPKCSEHHRQWTEHTGVFAGWTKDKRRMWADALILATQQRHDRLETT